MGTSPRIVIGDVHGCLDELEDLLDRLSPPRDARFLFTGDLVNRGPDPAGVVRRVRALGGGCVLGNHDLHALGVVAGTRVPRDGDALDPLLRADDSRDLLDWLRCQPLVREWDDLVLVHAGLHPAWGERGAATRALAPATAAMVMGEIRWDDPAVAFATRARYCTADGTISTAITAPPDGHEPWDTFYRGDRLVACGHWAARGVRSNGVVRCLDGACVYGGELAAWLVEEDRIVTVPARRRYAARS